jgi:RimJ/RimL family protein N-acetyltransferase
VELLFDRAVTEQHDPILDRVIWGRPVDPELDTPLITWWMNRPHVEEFWQMAWPEAWIEDYLRRHFEDPTRTAILGFIDKDPIGYMEVYNPAEDVLGAYAPIQPGDIGAHVLIGEEDSLGKHSIALGFACNRYLFDRPGVTRIVGEPDVRNHNFMSLLAFLGYRRHREIDLPDKRAAFMVCERRDFERLSSRRNRAG